MKSINSICLSAILLATTSCSNHSKVYSDFNKLISSHKPLKIVETLSIDYETPEDETIYNVDSEGQFKSMTSVDYNWSGDYGGPSSMNISLDESSKTIVLRTTNITGSHYSGFDTWDDTFYLPFNDETWAYDEVVTDSTYSGTKFGLGFKAEIPSDQDTHGYLGNIFIFDDEPNRMFIYIFGGGSSKWSIRSQFYFEDNILDEFKVLMSTLNEKYK